MLGLARWKHGRTDGRSPKVRSPGAQFNVAEKIRRLRSRRNWSQEQLARELGVSVRTVTRWEAGETEPSHLARRVIELLLEERV